MIKSSAWAMKQLLVISLILFCAFASKGQSLTKKRVQLLLMGSSFEITAVATNDSIAQFAIESGINEIKRIENLISSWDPNSQTSEINRNAGVKSVQVDKELFDLVKRANKISQLTDGAFDISFASMEHEWKFDKQENQLPDSAKVLASINLIDWKNIDLEEVNRSVYLREKGMRIGFGAIGKGYAAMQAKSVMSKIDGVEGGVVNAGGDLIVWGRNEESENYKVQISDPGDPKRSIAWINVKNTSVVTSGDYEKYFTYDGVRYAHIIDPKSGYPCTGIKSVTVICSNTELGDALATSIFVLGTNKGMKLINAMEGIECLIVDDQNKIQRSSGLDLNYY